MKSVAIDAAIPCNAPTTKRPKDPDPAAICPTGIQFIAEAAPNSTATGSQKQDDSVIPIRHNEPVVRSAMRTVLRPSAIKHLLVGHQHYPKRSSHIIPKVETPQTAIARMLPLKPEPGTSIASSFSSSSPRGLPARRNVRRRNNQTNGHSISIAGGTISCSRSTIQARSYADMAREIQRGRNHVLLSRPSR